MILCPKVSLLIWETFKLVKDGEDEKTKGRSPVVVSMGPQLKILLEMQEETGINLRPQKSPRASRRLGVNPANLA